MAASESFAPDSSENVRENAIVEVGHCGQIVVGLAVAALIIVGALAVGVRSGWESIGTGGVNRSMLPKVGDPALERVMDFGPRR